MRAALVLHGDAPGKEDLALLEACDLVVAADGAALPLLAAGIAPDRIVGDLDSLGPAGEAEARRRGVALEPHPMRKDRTDGELALDAVLAAQPDEVLVLGAHGGRTAQFLGNLRLLRRIHEAGVVGRLRGRGEEARYLGPGESWTLHAVGGTLNLLAADAPGARVRIRGCGWSGTTLLGPREARGLSNPIEAIDAEVAVEQGLALAVVEFPQ
jgi:thiamine pyrophosphokinase